MSNQLRPIETAPKGRYILLFGRSGYMDTPLRCEVGCWSRSKERWNNHAGDAFTDDGEEPTHWMPLPELDGRPMLKIGDIIETTRPMSEFSLQHGQHLRMKLLTPESVAYANNLIAMGQWRKVDEDTTKTEGFAQ